MRFSVLLVLLVALPGLFGFDLSRHSIEPKEILSGGPPKDGIPALSNPRFVSAGEAGFLRLVDRVVGVVHAGRAKAYPLRILNWHEVVNDAVGEEPVVVTYCPLTGSAVVYDRNIDGKTLSFGVSGRLYQSNVLLYDRESESLWSQLGHAAVTGRRTGTALSALPSVVTTWGDWKAEHPKTLVLSTDTGYRRDYSRDPYVGYRRSRNVMFPVSHGDNRLHAKEQVFGIQIGDAEKAYPLAILARHLSFTDRVGGQEIRLRYDRGARKVSARAVETGRPVPGVVLYWFAWAAFHPKTEIWRPQGEAEPRPASEYDAVPGRAVSGPDVVVSEHSAYWTDVFGVGVALIGGNPHGGPPGLLVIRGKLVNGSGHPLHHVKLRYDLLDGEGRVVATEIGYNRAGETLRTVDSPVSVQVKSPVVRPIPAGGGDSFRMVFLREETPEFTTYQVRVLGAPLAGRPSPAATPPRSG